MPLTKLNTQMAIVQGIDRRSQDERLAYSQAQKTFCQQQSDNTRLRLSDFDKIEKIGQGTFGKVYRAEYRDPASGEVKLYALKKLNMIMDDMSDQGFPLTALREIKYLSTLDHENIVTIRQVIHAKPSEKNKMRGSYFLLFDYLHYDLTGMTDKKIKFSLSQVKCVMQQLLQGLVYLHEQKNLAHRDIKGANILLNRSGQVQIADFGLARMLYPGNQNKMYTTKVVTLWYRAPELLLGFRNYNFGVDIWSMACVFAELVTGQVLFRACQEAEACTLMFGICGTPSESNMPNCTKMRNYHALVREHNQPRHLKEHLRTQMMKSHLLTGFDDSQSVDQVLGEHWFDLIDQMLCYDQNKRIKASQALLHPFFTDPAQSPACQPNELPVTTLQEDHHEYITKAERNKKKDFRKVFSFRHNLDVNNYNYDNSHQSDRRYVGSDPQQASLWKATLATTASTSTISQHHPHQAAGGSSFDKNDRSGYQKPVPPPQWRGSTKPIESSRYGQDRQMDRQAEGEKAYYSHNSTTNQSRRSYKDPQTVTNSVAVPQAPDLSELKTTAPTIPPQRRKSPSAEPIVSSAEKATDRAGNNKPSDKRSADKQDYHRQRDHSPYHQRGRYETSRSSEGRRDYSQHSRHSSSSGHHHGHHGVGASRLASSVDKLRGVPKEDYSSRDRDRDRDRERDRHGKLSASSSSKRYRRSRSRSRSRSPRAGVHRSPQRSPKGHRSSRSPKSPRGSRDRFNSRERGAKPAAAVKETIVPAVISKEVMADEVIQQALKVAGKQEPATEPLQPKAAQPAKEPPQPKVAMPAKAPPQPKVAPCAKEPSQPKVAPSAKEPPQPKAAPPAKESPQPKAAPPAKELFQPKAALPQAKAAPSTVGTVLPSEKPKHQQDMTIQQPARMRPQENRDRDNRDNRDNRDDPFALRYQQQRQNYHGRRVPSNERFHTNNHSYGRGRGDRMQQDRGPSDQWNRRGGHSPYGSRGRGSSTYNMHYGGQGHHYQRDRSNFDRENGGRGQGPPPSDSYYGYRSRGRGGDRYDDNRHYRSSQRPPGGRGNGSYPPNSSGNR